MQTFSLKTMALIGAAFIATTGSAMANDMINNQASGYIGGNRFAPPIEQFERTYGRGENNFNIEVGSITAKRAENNRAEGFVEGSVTQHIEGDRNTLDLKVGSITAERAMNNRAEGRVDGNVFQSVYGEEQSAKIHVGAIDAGEKGTAFNNDAFGVVRGDIIQEIGYGTNANLRVGSITQP